MLMNTLFSLAGLIAINLSIALSSKTVTRLSIRSSSESAPGSTSTLSVHVVNFTDLATYLSTRDHSTEKSNTLAPRDHLVLPDDQLYTPLIGEHECRLDNTMQYIIRPEEGTYFRVGDIVSNRYKDICQTQGKNSYTFTGLMQTDIGIGRGDGPGYFVFDEDCRIRSIWNIKSNHKCNQPWGVKVPYLKYVITHLFREPALDEKKFKFNYADGLYEIYQSKGSSCRKVKELRGSWFGSGNSDHPLGCAVAFPIFGEHGPHGRDVNGTLIEEA
ncbi:MAG: hypothetical protein MMC23_002020 [Stictis urceolatum]|nr:hypothetical protein [Stictis urceolata]